MLSVPSALLPSIGLFPLKNLRISPVAVKYKLLQFFFIYLIDLSINYEVKKEAGVETIHITCI